MSITENNKVNEYINNVCKLIKNKKVHNEIKEELLDHINDIIDDYLEIGMSLDVATDKALMQMGNSEVIGHDLNKAHKSNSDWLLLIITTCLISFGFLTTAFLQLNTFNDNYYINYISKLLLFLVISIVLSLCILKLDYRKFKKYSLTLYIISISLILLTSTFALPINGMRHWLIIGSFSIDTLAITPILLIISLAGIFDNYNWTNKISLFKGLILVFIPIILFISLSSLSTVVIYLIATFTIMHISGFKLKYLIIFSSALGSILLLSIFRNAYRTERLFIFLNPSQDIDNAGWIYNQLNTLRNSSGLLGTGSTINNSVLPAANMEFALTSIIYCFGWIIGIMVMALVLSFIIRIAFISRNTKNTYGKLLVSGLCSLFAIQFILNILANFSLSPILGINMPFISYGGNQLIINILSICIINNVYKFRNVSSTLSN
ncbi:MAG: FtsW/RodA/SpoVE family cell cycle protein [Clostridium sp.]|nr:FtsW/RodA/SpoVE family cell cycle protein [Clostridium sp.]